MATSKGTFAGAVQSVTGRFARADGGAIFFDEIRDISWRVQLMLLRVLEEHEFERIGSSRSLRVNVRVIAATNSNLLEKMRQGVFRGDLYYRLKVADIRLPPLRERRADIALLVEHFRLALNHKFRNR